MACSTIAGEQAILPKITEPDSEINGAVGNPFFTSMVGGHVEILDRGCSSSAATSPLVVVKFDVPNLAFSTLELRQAFIEERHLHRAAGARCLATSRRTRG